jgi:mono/diheme cytochrome c family protein
MSISTRSAQTPVASRRLPAHGLLAALALCLLAACGGKEPPQAPAAASAPAPADAAAAPVAPPAPDPAPPPAPVEPTPLPKGEAIVSTPELVEEGRKIYFSAGCNACHGGTGGGGMCPPLTNDVWIYGDSDDVLRALISEGTAGMVAHGLPRIGKENVVGQMPPFAAVLKEGDVDKLVAFIHSVSSAKAAGGAK